MNWDVILDPATLQLYAEGLLVTVQLLLACLAIGAVLALLMALALTGRQAWLRQLVGAYTFCIRGTPLLLQVYLIYYGLAQLDWIQQRWDAIWPWTYFKEPFFCALLAFALNNAGYTAEMLAGAIRETPHGEIEAAQAMGMGRCAVLRRIVLRTPSSTSALGLWCGLLGGTPVDQGDDRIEITWPGGRILLLEDGGSPPGFECLEADARAPIDTVWVAGAAVHTTAR